MMPGEMLYDSQETFIEKIDAELDLVREPLTAFKAQSAVYNNAARSSHARHVRDLEHKLDQVKARLYDLEKADESEWEQLKDGVEGMWTTLQSTLEDTVATFKEEEA